MDLSQFDPSAVSLALVIPVTIALTKYVRDAANLPGRVVPLVALVIATAFGTTINAYLGRPLAEGAMAGFLAGLGAVGAHSTYNNLTDAGEPTEPATGG